MKPKIDIIFDEENCKRIAVIGHIDFATWYLDSNDWIEIGGWLDSLGAPIKRIACYCDQVPRNPLIISRMHERLDVSEAIGVKRKTGFRLCVNIDGLLEPFTLYLTPLFSTEKSRAFRKKSTFYDQNINVVAKIVVTYRMSNDISIQELARLTIRDINIMCDYIDLNKRHSFILKYEDILARKTDVMTALSNYLAIKDLNLDAMDTEVAPGHATSVHPSEFEDESDKHTLYYLQQYFAPYLRHLGY